MSAHKRKPSKTHVPEAPHGYEFGGPLGAFGITFGLPLLIYATFFFCNDVSGCPAPALLHPSTLTWSKLRAQIPWSENGVKGIYSTDATLWVSAYYFLSLFLQLVLPGEHVEGLQLDSGGRHTYKFNAFNSAVITLAGLALGTLLYGSSWIVWTYIWDNPSRSLPPICWSPLVPPSSSTSAPSPFLTLVNQILSTASWQEEDTLVTCSTTFSSAVS